MSKFLADFIPLLFGSQWSSMQTWSWISSKKIVPEPKLNNFGSATMVA